MSKDMMHAGKYRLKTKRSSPFFSRLILIDLYSVYMYWDYFVNRIVCRTTCSVAAHPQNNLYKTLKNFKPMWNGFGRLKDFSFIITLLNMLT
jgi:hypothetical protein